MPLRMTAASGAYSGQEIHVEVGAALTTGSTVPLASFMTTAESLSAHGQEGIGGEVRTLMVCVDAPDAEIDAPPSSVILSA